MSETVSSNGQRRLGRTDWIQAAIDVMIGSSVDQVRVEKLATTLGVSKGSFYWHFKDRDDLLMSVLDHWRDRATLAVQNRLAHAEPRPDRRLLMFMELPLRSPAALRAADLETAILGWSRQSPDVRRIVEQVDATRVENVVRLFRALGLSETEADFRAHQAYAFLRYVAQRRDLDLAHRNDLTRRMHARLVADLDLAGGESLRPT